MPWRTGQSVGRTIYACPRGSAHRQGEILIGMMDNARLATEAVECHNHLLKLREQLADRLKGHANG